MDWSHDDTRLNGRKRYPARNRAIEALPLFDETKGGKSSVESVVRFLPAGIRFAGDILYRNLTAVELGALLWAVTLGKPGGERRHMLGHARSLGYGQFRADVVKAEGVDVRACLETFEAYMTEALGRLFADCEEIKSLSHMLDPRLGERINQPPHPMLTIPGGPKTYQKLRSDSVRTGRNILDRSLDHTSPVQASRDPVEHDQPTGNKGRPRR
ncbi:hypothetical protein AZL_010390 [Azospirillum sp. B510]|uniref:hypothetical protein n=1 Tax=Alphaproteobacteria TaxID=28211 RepID=UPI0001C4BE0D|nr:MULTISPECIES: hypothetical protein [Alphaproteobacteria]BAI71677.1 hypothetical protein AZL_010390 [Azospirillum sp. B510]